MPKKPTYGELQRRVAELEVQQQQQTIALRESEERFRVMQELSPDGFTILRPLRDAQGNIIDFTWIYENPAIARISGTDAKTVAGRCLLELFPGHGGSPFLEAYIQVAQTGESRVLEAQYSGESIRNPTWFRTVIVRMGQDIAILAQDITERKRLEAELHESRAKLETAFASMTEAIFIADADGRLANFNDEFIRYHRFKDRAECSKTIVECPTYLDAYFPNGKPAPVEMWAMPRALRGESRSNVEYMLRRKDTGETWWGSYNFGPIKDENGRITGAIVAAREITDQKRAEEALRERERLLQTVIDGSTSPIFLKDLDGKFITVNAALERMLGISREGIKGKTDYDVAPKEVADYWRSHDKQVMATRKAIQIEEVADLPDGHHTFLANKFPLVDVDGQIYGVGAISHDITDRKQAEEALSNAKEQAEVDKNRLETVLATIPLAVVIVGASDGKFLYINKRALELYGINYTGYDLESHITKVKALRLDGMPYPLEDMPVSLTLKDGEEVRNSEMIIQRTDGLHIPVLVSSAPLRDVNGNITAGIVVFEDITDRKQAERELREAKEQLELRVQERTAELTQALLALHQSGTYTRSLIESSLDPLVTIGPDGKITDVNAAAETATGRARQELIRTDFSAYFTEPEKARTGYLQVFREGSVRDYPLEICHQDGRTIPVLYNATLYRDEAGQVVGIFAAARDITERKRAEDALRQSEQEFRALAEAMPQIVWTTQPDGWNTYFNHQWVDYTGLTLEESYGHGWNKPFHPEDQQRAWDAWRNAVTNLDSYALECRLRRADGVYRWWLIRGVPVLDEKGNVLKWFGTCTDIEDLKRAEQSLRQANADLDQRASQLRALAGELTLSEQRERSRLAKVLHDHLQQLLVAAKFRTAVAGRGGDDLLKQATKEIEELLDESIAASRSLTAELSPPILHEAGLNAGLQWLARRIANTQGLFVTLELDESGSLAEDIKVLLFESVRELLLNVVKHANTRSAVVNLRHFDRFLQVTVSDEGAGFDPTTMPAAGEEGRGFGLFSIRERLGLMGGTFEMESTPGQGSRFVLCLPVAQSTKIEPPLQEIPILPEARLMSGYSDRGRRIRVLLADDHTVVRQGIANLLTDQPDIEVIGEAADGQAAVELAARLLPDAILMDMSMPKLNGIEATRIIHNDWPEIRIIGLSMFEETERAQAMRDAGAVDYITKSGPAEAMIDVIRSSVASNKTPR